MEKQRYHLIGICGVSMAGIALWLKNQGHEVSGSDLFGGENVEILKKHKIKVYIGHKKENVGNCDVVVYSGAIKNNVELEYSKKANKIILSRPQMLEMISKHYQKTIAISGAHGKTTTTALIYNCLKCANKNPTLHLGGRMLGQESGFVLGGKEYFVTEACEYQDSFLHLSPYIGVVLNVEKEHLDYFKTFENVKKSFEKFANNSTFCICNQKAKIEKYKNFVIFGQKNDDFCAKNIKTDKNYNYFFDVYKQKQFYGKFELSIPGKHNVLNALACIAVCDKLGVDKKDMFLGLKNFSGVKRRFEYISKNIIHDYAHHPTEIKKTLDIIKQKYSNQKVYIVFQPHTYSRTKTLMKDFVEVLKNCEHLCLYKTYSAREKYDVEGSAKTLCENIKQYNKKVKYFATEDFLINYLLRKTDEQSIIIFLGAGNINQVAENLAKTVDNAQRMC